MSQTVKIEQPIPVLRQEAERVITHSCFYVAGIGLIPIPLLDATLILGAQMLMVRNIAKVYGVPFKKQLAKSVIGSLTGSLGTIGAVKFIPGLGSTLGGAAISTIGTAMTYALGQVFSHHFSKGGDFLDLKAEDWQAAFQNYYQRKVAEEKLNNNEISDYKTATLEQLRDKQLTLKEELKNVETALNKFQKKKKLKRKRKWMLSIFAIAILVFCVWFFRANLFSANVNEAMEEVISESGTVLENTAHSLGVDSLVEKGTALIDSTIQEVSNSIDSLVQDSSLNQESATDTIISNE